MINRYLIEIFYSDEDGGNIAAVPELPGVLRLRRDRRRPRRGQDGDRPLARDGAGGRAPDPRTGRQAPRPFLKTSAARPS